MKTETLIVWWVVLITLAVILLGYGVLNKPDEGFRVSDLDSNVGYIFCDASINSKFFYCKDVEPSWGVSLYNITQEDLDQLIVNCPSGIIMDDRHCIGGYLTIRGDKE
jgi:hypothetical protein